jgi:hypothetical protein
LLKGKNIEFEAEFIAKFLDEFLRKIGDRATGKFCYKVGPQQEPGGMLTRSRASHGAPRVYADAAGADLPAYVPSLPAARPRVEDEEEEEEEEEVTGPVLKGHPGR